MHRSTHPSLAVILLLPLMTNVVKTIDVDEKKECWFAKAADRSSNLTISETRCSEKMSYHAKAQALLNDFYGARKNCYEHALEHKANAFTWRDGECKMFQCDNGILSTHARRPGRDIYIYTCHVMASSTRCRMPSAQRGTCADNIPMWTFNTVTRECELFIYSGCEPGGGKGKGSKKGSQKGSKKGSGEGEAREAGAIANRFNTNYDCTKMCIGIVSSEVGCVADRGGDVLGGSRLSNTFMSVGYCRMYCGKKGFKYFGLENGDECHCGDEPRVQGHKTIDCSALKGLPCAGSDEDACGGRQAIRLFKTNLLDGHPMLLFN